jgi:hypothetical protein
MGYTFNKQSKTFFARSGASLKLRYLDNDSDANNYQGHSYTWQCFDEAGNWGDPTPIDKLWATLRSPKGIPTRRLLTGNPGGPGHSWIKARYIDPVPPLRLNRIDGNITRVFIPSKVDDNEILMKSDPGYVDRIKQSGPEWLVRAWLEGDWNIVAGGMFSDVLTEKNILKPFDIPAGWKVNRCFDWGSSAPYAVLWTAESNGEGTLPRGSIVVIAEEYGWSGKPNEGLRLTVRDIAERIKKVDKYFPTVRPGPADSAIFTRENGASIADDFDRCGVRWEPADKGPGSRSNGWQKMRDLLANGGQKDVPGLYFFETCRQCLRTIPGLPRDPRKLDDVDTDAEDHIADALRYRIMWNPGVSKVTQVSWG